MKNNKEKYIRDNLRELLSLREQRNEVLEELEKDLEKTINDYLINYNILTKQIEVVAGRLRDIL